MRSSGTHARLRLAVTGALCVLLLGACSKFGGSSASSTTTAGTATATTACGLLTKAEVAQATGQSIAFNRQTDTGSVSSCTFGSLSGFAVALSVTNSSAASLTSAIPGLGNIVANYNLAPVSGLGDQAYGGADAIIARKGNTVFDIVYADLAGGSHEQALKIMATDVVSRL